MFLRRWIFEFSSKMAAGLWIFSSRSHPSIVLSRPSPYQYMYITNAYQRLPMPLRLLPTLTNALPCYRCLRKSTANNFLRNIRWNLETGWIPQTFETVALSHDCIGASFCLVTYKRRWTPIHDSEWICMSQWYQGLLIWRSSYKSLPGTIWHSNCLYSLRNSN